MIISIGNITFGGTGKTPFTIMLAKHYIEQEGKTVCILSRGYKGKIGSELNIVSDGNRILIEPPHAGDEAYMMAAKVPKAIVITDRNRGEAYNYAKRIFQPDVFILDDGFQTKTIDRNVDILLLDYNNPVSTGLLFPFGYLRSRPSSIAKADIIVFTRSPEGAKTIPKRVQQYVEGKPVFFSSVITDSIVVDDKPMSLEEAFTKRWYCFSGIAKNGNFYATVKDLGINLIKYKSFKDHYQYTKKDFLNMMNAAMANDCEYILTTQKDYVKIPKDLRHFFGYLKISLKINDFDKLTDSISKFASKS